MLCKLIRHATFSDLPPSLAKQPLKIAPPTRLSVPFEFPSLTLNRATIRIINAVILGIQSSNAPLKHYEQFFYPLDLVNNWNRGYGRRGFAQYQFVVPFKNSRRNMRAIMGTIMSSGELPFLNILKRLGEKRGGLLSFPCEGYTFAIDFPIRRNTVDLLRSLDTLVVEAGGRTYLGKDAVLERSMFRRMYPRWKGFLALKQKYDPQNVFVSDMARRLGLVYET